MNQPFFSIITCTYNSWDFINKNLWSIETQTCRDFEHIFIDGYSSDSTLDVLHAYKKHKNYVHIYQSNPQWISMATWKYIIHLHSDDSFFNRHSLQKCKEFLLKRPDLDRIYGKIVMIEKDSTIIGQFPNQSVFQINKWQNWKKYLLKYVNFIPHQATCIRKDVFSRFGNFDESLSYAMDYDLWLRLRLKTNFSFIDTKVSKFMIRSWAQSTWKENQKANKKVLLKVLKKHLNIFEYPIFLVVNYLIWLKMKKYIR